MENSSASSLASSAVSADLDMRCVAATPPPSTTLVICTRDRTEVTDAVWSALASDHPAFEVLLIDQSSHPVGPSLPENISSDPRFRVIHMAARGVARARNVGLREARGEIVAFTDDDCTVPAEWLRVLEGQVRAHPRVGMAFTKVTAGPHDERLGFIPAYAPQGSVLVSSLWGKRRARGIGAGMAVRQRAALAVGAFDESLGPGGRFPSCEEGDLAVRLLLGGWQVLETDATAVTHHGFRTWEEGRDLARRNWVGVGAAYAKPLKCGRVTILPVLGYELSATLRRVAAHLRHGEKPRGLRDAAWLLSGVAQGLRAPLDAGSLTFAPEGLDRA